ncbi:MAG: cyclic nucleotide-binding domain-containing protein [Gammaproteobacteria bacterium]|jgi:CRP-like cAMP-binding protein|nr:cyclic nucleotide-binding domain-containing protein [Gammaproteobacteria bacterium]
MSDNTCTDMDVSAAAIKASPLGEELSDAQCELLASVMTACGIKDQAFLIEENQKDDCLHVLTSGNMEVVTHAAHGELVGLQILRAGDILGELGFLDGVEHSASVRAMGNCELLRLDRTSFESLLEKDPDLVYKVMRAIVRTVHRILRNMNFQQVELTNYIAKMNGRY